MNIYEAEFEKTMIQLKARLAGMKIHNNMRKHHGHTDPEFMYSDFQAIEIEAEKAYKKFAESPVVK